MIDLIAITIGLLGFIGWSALMLFGGYSLCQRREQNARQQRIDALLEDAQKRLARLSELTTANAERKTPSAETRKRAQA